MSFRLRPFLVSDAEALSALDSHPEVARFQEYEARSLAEAADYITRWREAQSETPLEWVEQAIADETDDLIGRVGASVHVNTAHVWYVLHPRFQGRGIASSAVKELMLMLPNIKVFEIECDPLNLRSRRMAVRLGFTLVSEVSSGVMVKGMDTGSCVYRLVRA